jgi:predicted nucleotidyltransferase
MKTLRKNYPKEYWTILNTGKSTKQPDIEFKELFNFFKHLNTLKETNEPENTLNIDLAELNESINSSITKDEIFKGIKKKLKNNKAFGDDQVVNEYMKTTSYQFVDIYEKLFNLIFDTGIIPESWLLGTIKPFYKK